MSESRYEHVRKNLDLCGKIAVEFWDRPENAPVTIGRKMVRSKPAKILPMKHGKISKKVIRSTAQAMSDISDHMDAMKAQAAAKVRGQ